MTTKLENIDGRQSKRRRSFEWTIYVLRLEIEANGREVYYVGRTRYFDRRLKDHKQDTADVSHFHPEMGRVRGTFSVKQVIQKEKVDTMSQAQIDERRKYVELVNKHGIYSVSGGVAP